jgi:phage gp36-like protein
MTRTAPSYCSSADLSQYGIRAEALGNIDASILQVNIAAASDVIDSYLRSRFTLPLLAWGSDITAACAGIAVYKILKVRGFNSARASDEVIKDAYDEAIKWLVDISNERAMPNVTDSASGAQAGEPSGGGTVQVSSYQSRGYFTPDGFRGGAFTGRRC